MDANPKRRWFRFSVRTMMAVVALACVAFAWLGHKVREKQRERAVVASIRELGGNVAYDFELDNAGGKNGRPGPAWLRSWLGDDFFAGVASVEIDSRYASHDLGLRQLRSLPQLRQLLVSDPQFTDGDLAQLRELTQLRLLLLVGAQVTEQGCGELQRGLPKLQIMR